MHKNATILVDFDYTLFDTTKFIEFLSKSPKNIDYRDFLYPDSINFINYASEFGNPTLFSEGEVEFQKEKINGTEIGKLFSGGVRIFPSYSKLEDLAKNIDGSKIILIDDKPEVIDGAASLGCKVIRIKRGKYSEQKTKIKPDFEVASLSEIVDRDLLRII